MKNIFEKFLPFGTVLSAAACPACFPALAAVGSAFGLSFFAQYEREALVVMQIFMILTMVLFYVSYRRTKFLPSFIIGLLAGGLMFFAWYVAYTPFIFYLGMTGIISVSFWNLWLERKIPSCKDGACPTNCK